MPGTTVGSSSNEGESYRIIKERMANKLIYSDNTAVIGETYQYEEDLGALPWKLGEEKITILSYPASSATLTFRGRNYKAWFTTEIPVNDGPWKFMGLPGLIVKIGDDKEEVGFSLIGVEQLSGGVPIQKEVGKVFKCSRADLVKLKKKQDGGMQINTQAGALTISSMPGTYNYFAIELE
jgi:GLPGLI family protein